MNNNLTLNLNLNLYIHMPDDGNTGGVYFGTAELLDSVFPIKDFTDKTIAYRFRDKIFC